MQRICLGSGHRKRDQAHNSSHQCGRQKLWLSHVFPSVPRRPLPLLLELLPKAVHKLLAHFVAFSLTVNIRCTGLEKRKHRKQAPSHRTRTPPPPTWQSFIHTKRDTELRSHLSKFSIDCHVPEGNSILDGIYAWSGFTWKQACWFQWNASFLLSGSGLPPSWDQSSAEIPWISFSSTYLQILNS